MIFLTDTSEVLSLLNKGVKFALKQSETDESATRDGMDIAFLSFDLNDASKIQFAGAYRSLCIVRNGELIDYKANKFPIGNASMERGNFTNNEIEVQKGDMCYIFTDGYADQFGGDQGKKFMVKKLHKLLIENSSLPVEQQEKNLDTAIINWMGDHEQIDDILVIGIRV